jgi:aspartate/methionine/tyrosine aminotransferase
VRIEPENVAITSGCNQAFCVAMDVLARAGDEVILPTPYYFNHQMWLEMRGIRPVYVHSDETGSPTPEAIAGAVTERTRAVALVTPNNPTGAEYSGDLVMAIYELARAKGIKLVMDETYKDFRADEPPPHALFERPDWQDVFIQLYSFSKAYSLTGYRVGAMVAGPATLEQAIKVLDSASICPSHIGQHAALFALDRLQPWKERKAAMMRERVATLRRSFLDNRLRYRLVSSGAYFAYIKHPFEHLGATAVARRLADEHNVLCLPGDMFGPNQDAFLRFAFANLEAEQIPALVARLVESQGG